MILKLTEVILYFKYLLLLRFRVLTLKMSLKGTNFKKISSLDFIALKTIFFYLFIRCLLMHSCQTVTIDLGLFNNDSYMVN